MTEAVNAFLSRADASLAGKDEHFRKMFRGCWLSTLETTVKPTGSDTFVITGDIPAMWLRDSSAQVEHYLPLIKEDKELNRIVGGVVRRQAKNILIDPYANAFNLTPDNAYKRDTDRTELNGWIWERKYEVDSLCWPLRLAHGYWRAGGDLAVFDAECQNAYWRIVETFRTEQRHEGSSYRFVRDLAKVWGRETETLQNGGRGMPVNYTGMTWSGFRPSDDACTFGYLIPSEMFAAVEMKHLAEMARQIWHDERLAAAASELAEQIDYGIRKYGTVLHPRYGRIWAYETDGSGTHELMDDANVPSLLAAPYLGYCRPDDPTYLATRAFVLSHDNPYYYSGGAASGIGSPHTPDNYVWHISLAMQGLTGSREEAKRMADLIAATDAGRGLAHEGFDCQDASHFTREWFSWANSMFAAVTVKAYDLK